MVEWELLALIYLLSVCRCWRFVLNLVATKVPLTFAWCTWLFMVCGDDFFFIVCGDGCILRTHRVLGKGVVYPWCEDGFIFMSWYTLDTRLEL